MYDPIDLSKKIEKLVTRDNKKKYYRFRPTRFYGGIATADTVGCNIRCKFCWSGQSVWNPNKTGEFYSPEEVSGILNDISKKNGYHQLRVSGGEPTIGGNHLIKLLDNIDDEYLFILETNGILLGFDKSYVEDLSKFSNLHVRVCLKGISNEEFSWLTGAKYGFNYQIKALEFLKDAGLNFNIALVSIKKNKRDLFDRLNDIGLEKITIEYEKIKLYPAVRKRLESEDILDFFI
jgi:uncharacterized Fe-S cluster-containing radical SAM superfamily protein